MARKAIICIEGMHCASCAANIERSLRKVKGIKEANINLIAKKGFVNCDENVSEEELRKAISRVGNYKATKIEFEGNSGNPKNMIEHPSMPKKEHEKFMREHREHKTHEHSKGIEDREIGSWFKRMVLGWIVTLPIIAIMLSERVFEIMLFDEFWSVAAILILAFPVVFIFGFETIRGGLKGFTSFYFNMDSLIALGTVLAYLTGILSFFFSIQDYSGVSAMIMTIFITGKYIEYKARGRSSQEIKKLLEMEAKTARVLKGNKEVDILVSEVVVGDIIIIKPGEKIPTDGIVIRGESSVDESMISGESMPVDKLKGSNVIGATINQDGILYVKATKIGKDTFLAHIIKLVEEAQGTKVPIQKLADKITNIFVPAILVLSIFTFIGWLYFSRDFGRAIGVAISVLVIACPCALGLATPIALTVGFGMGAKKGVLIRKGEAIQTMKEIKTVIFDKTGTITKGKPEVTNVYSKTKEVYLIETAASLERLSEHPLSKAVVNYAEKKGIKKFKEVKEFKILRGRGVEGKVGKKEVVIGNQSLMKEKKISVNGFEDAVRGFEEGGKTAIIIAENKKVLGIIGIADAIKEDSVIAVAHLNENGYKTAMITGDNERTAHAIAKQVGIREVISNVLPEDKARKVEELQKRGMVCFVGDGINDAPALKQANVGIAIGTGTDIAIEAGDIVLARGSLRGVIYAIKLSKATFSKIKQNLFWAFAYNVIAIPVAVAGILHPVIAEIAMAASSITVVVNANLLRRKRI